MATLGNYLKKEREARDISLSEVSDFTKISITYLDFLEKDEFAKIPGEAYVKGYISSYAECLGINDHEALKLYDSHQIASDDVEEAEPNIRKAKPFFFLSINKIWIGVVVCILAMLTFGVLFFMNQKNAADSNSLEQSNTTIRPTPTSKIEPDITSRGEANNSFISMKKNVPDQQLENEPVRKKDVNDPIPGPTPPGTLHPEQNSTEVVSDAPSIEYPGLKALPASENAQTRPENNVKVADATGSENAQTRPGNNEKVPEATASETDRTRLENNEKVVEASVSGNDQTRPGSNIKVVEATACSAIDNRLPQGLGDSFEWSTDRIYIWTRIESEKPPAAIRHIYYFKGQKVSDILLKIGSSHWRTWSYKTIASERYVGRWRVDLTTADGKLLQSIHFEIK